MSVYARFVVSMLRWPFGPIRYLYEWSDTGPDAPRPAHDPFAVAGHLDTHALGTLIGSLSRQAMFAVNVELRREGTARAGSVTDTGSMAAGHPHSAGSTLNAAGEAPPDPLSQLEQTVAGDRPRFRIVLNHRLTDAQRFVTLAHELGHIFCGHLGACGAGVRDGASGWPDRSDLPDAEREIEAEAVADIVGSRAGLSTASASYLQRHVRNADLAQVDLDIITRAAARIERLAKLRYGSIAFE